MDREALGGTICLYFLLTCFVFFITFNSVHIKATGYYTFLFVRTRPLV